MAHRAHGRGVVAGRLERGDEALDKLEDITIRVVEGHGRDAQDVGLAPIAENALFDEAIADGALGGLDAQR